jgi:hypothetical protein
MCRKFVINLDKSTAVTDNTIVMNLETTWMSKGQVGREEIFLSSNLHLLEVRKP